MSCNPFPGAMKALVVGFPKFPGRSTRDLKHPFTTLISKQTNKTLSVKRTIKKEIPCLRCGEMAGHPGPDGYKTLCPFCSVMYAAFKLQLYKTKRGAVTVCSGHQTRKVIHIGFEKIGMERDLAKPIVREQHEYDSDQHNLLHIGPKDEDVPQENKENTAISFPMVPVKVAMRRDAEWVSTTLTILRTISANDFIKQIRDTFGLYARFGVRCKISSHEYAPYRKVAVKDSDMEHLLAHAAEIGFRNVVLEIVQLGIYHRDTFLDE